MNGSRSLGLRDGAEVFGPSFAGSTFIVNLATNTALADLVTPQETTDIFRLPNDGLLHVTLIEERSENQLQMSRHLGGVEKVEDALGLVAEELGWL